MSNTTTYPFLIIESKNHSIDEMIEFGRKWVKKNNRSVKSDHPNLDEFKLITDDELNSSSLQEIIKTAQMSVTSETIKVIYIKWTEKLNRSGNFNKLLKLFEEPAKNTSIILLNQQHILPKTIKSRGITINMLNPMNEGTHSKLETEKTCTVLKDYFDAYAKGEISPHEFSQHLKQRPAESQDFLEALLESLTKKQLTYKKCNILGKIVRKYNQNKKLNLNNFDNIIIPLKKIFNEEISHL